MMNGRNGLKTIQKNRFPTNMTHPIYAWKDDKFWHIDEVPNGLECGCICYDCKAQLVACNSEKNKIEHHFKHYSKSEGCGGAGETILHYLAKEIILETKSVVLPKFGFTLPIEPKNYRDTIIEDYIVYKYETFEFDEVIAEQWQGDFRPDLTCIKNGQKLYVEIVFSHDISPATYIKMKQTGFPVLRINLKKMPKHVHRNVLERQLFRTNAEVIKREWVINRKNDIIEEKFIRIVQQLQTDMLTYTKWLKVYSKSNLVYCPKKENERVSRHKECRTCRYFVKREKRTREIVSHLSDEIRYEVEDEYVLCIYDKYHEWGQFLDGMISSYNFLHLF